MNKVTKKLLRSEPGLNISVPHTKIDLEAQPTRGPEQPNANIACTDNLLDTISDI